MLPALTITCDKITDKTLFSPELLFPDLNVFAREMPYDSRGYSAALDLCYLSTLRNKKKKELSVSQEAQNKFRSRSCICL